MFDSYTDKYIFFTADLDMQIQKTQLLPLTTITTTSNTTTTTTTTATTTTTSKTTAASTPTITTTLTTITTTITTSPATFTTTLFLKRVYYKRTEFAPIGSKFFLFRVNHFQKGFSVQKSKHKS